MIRIICLGKIKEEYLKDAINDYSKRISKYHKLEIVELKDDINIQKEEAQMEKYLDKRAFNIAMVIDAKEVTSPELSKIIDSSFITNSTINFFIGSSNGLAPSIIEGCNMKMSFGKITMPHGLFRLILCEQIYRAFKIANNENYHK